MERYVVADKSCGWPKLVKLNDGSLLMDIYNKPHHGGYNGEEECWKSEDGGRSFKFIGYPFLPEEGYSQKDDCLGVAHNGDVICAMTGYPDKCGVNLSRSTDGGHTFKVISENILEDIVPGYEIIACFGHIVRIPNGHTLAMCIWRKERINKNEAACYTYICFSDDDGFTWNRAYRIGDGTHQTNEASVYFFDENHGIAVCRATKYTNVLYYDDEGKPMWDVPKQEKFSYNEGMLQYRTHDGGKTWAFEGAVTGACAHPANLCMLDSGELVLTYGCRYKPLSLICVQVTTSEGYHWDDPQVLGVYESADGGYPSSVQNPDGSVCTVYYVQSSAYHTGYHIASVIWNPKDIIKDGWGDFGPQFVRNGSNFLYSGKADCLNPDWQFIL